MIIEKLQQELQDRPWLMLTVFLLLIQVMEARLKMADMPTRDEVRQAQHLGESAMRSSVEIQGSIDLMAVDIEEDMIRRELDILDTLELAGGENPLYARRRRELESQLSRQSRLRVQTKEALESDSLKLERSLDTLRQSTSPNLQPVSPVWGSQ